MAVLLRVVMVSAAPRSIIALVLRAVQLVQVARAELVDDLAVGLRFVVVRHGEGGEHRQDRLAPIPRPATTSPGAYPALVDMVTRMPTRSPRRQRHVPSEVAIWRRFSPRGSNPS
jgi:hypothetical protein